MKSAIREYGDWKVLLLDKIKIDTCVWWSSRSKTVDGLWSKKVEHITIGACSRTRRSDVARPVPFLLFSGIYHGECGTCAFPGIRSSENVAILSVGSLVKQTRLKIGRDAFVWSLGAPLEPPKHLNHKPKDCHQKPPSDNFSRKRKRVCRFSDLCAVKVVLWLGGLP